MNAPKIWKLVPAVMVCCVVGLASAKLPPPPVDPAKAEEAKQKAADAAKKDAEAIAKAQDRVADRYKKQQKVAAAPATTAAKKK